ncbi:MAG: ABC transporter ATP-binding protein, partial [Gammaproteobacteria bacterium]
MVGNLPRASHLLHRIRLQPHWRSASRRHRPSSRAATVNALLDVDGLVTHFEAGGEVTEAVRDVSFQIHPGETVCLVGESGSGKSVTGLSILGLLPDSARHPNGTITLSSGGTSELSLLDAEEETLQKVRGARISMIFQEPMTCLNPVLTIGEQLMEPLELHLGLLGEAARNRARELLELVEMPEPERRLDEYPHRLSGGQRQR